MYVNVCLIACKYPYVRPPNCCMCVCACDCLHTRTPALSAWHYSTNSKEFVKLINSDKLRKIRNAMNFELPRDRRLQTSQCLCSGPCRRPCPCPCRHEILTSLVTVFFQHPLPSLFSGIPDEHSVPTFSANMLSQRFLPTSPIDILCHLSLSTSPANIACHFNHPTLLASIPCLHPC